MTTFFVSRRNLWTNAHARLELFQSIPVVMELQMVLWGGIFLAACHFTLNSAVVLLFMLPAFGKLVQAGVCVGSEVLETRFRWNVDRNDKSCPKSCCRCKLKTRHGDRRVSIIWFWRRVQENWMATQEYGSYTRIQLNK